MSAILEHFSFQFQYQMDLKDGLSFDGPLFDVPFSNQK